jgi:hypothetical protein
MTVDIHDVDYHTRTGAHLINRALAWGWDPTEGEGAVEFITRKAYEQAVEDLVDGHYLAVSHKTEYLLKKSDQHD